MHKFTLKKTLLFFFFSFSALVINGNTTDSAYIEKYDKTIYYNSDTVFANYACKGYLPILDDMYEYYEEVFQYLPDDKKDYEVSKMRQVAKIYESNELENEADFVAVLSLPDDNEYELKTKVKKMQAIVNKAEEENNITMQLRSMVSVFDIYWSSMKYAKAFHQIGLIDKILQKATDDQYPDKGRIYFKIGEAYFFFRDYEKAIPYLRKAMKPSKYFYDRSNIKARNTLGTYYNLKGQIDSAEYYFRSAFANEDVVKDKSLHDAISLCNLGHSLILREQYDKAIPYFEASIARTLLDYDYRSASYGSLGLAQCYIEKDDVRKAKSMIDSTLLYIEKSDYHDLERLLYPVICKYYFKIRDNKMTKAYLDSSLVAHKRFLDKYNSLHILRAEQELFEAETYAKDEELKIKEENYRQKLLFSIGVICFISLILLVIALLYRKSKIAYQALVLKNQDWAATNPVFESYHPVATVRIKEEDDVSSATEEEVDDAGNEPDEEDIQLIQKVHDLIKKEKIYKDLDLTLEVLSKQMNVNRNYMSKAINKTTGKNFNTFINEYRIKEAIKIMSDEKSDLISLDAIALEVGFSNRTTFYQSFKKVTGLTPSDFRNNKIKNESDQ
ncbi:helix-turn-helix domain-containing protein [Prevotella sp. 10(H)]|uniref:helix-turn-helix domain-containing protein n=1 Tax=Prevotella sp. 10(H) TaxID=1158294 RepID=UPI000A5C2FE2|nr:helix-turn-helix domain-containing protein [Prevotella sp. 10(H)]